MGHLTESEHLVELYSTNFNFSKMHEFKQLIQHTYKLGHSLDVDKQTKSVKSKHVWTADKK